VDSAAFSVPIGESDLSVTYTPVTGSPIVYHVLIKRSILITNMWFEGTTVESPTNFDASTTVTVPLSPVWDANATGYTGFSVSVPHGVVKGRLVWTYSRVGEQNVSGYSLDYDVPSGARTTSFNYDSVAKTGTATTGWGTLGVGENRYLVFSGTGFVGGGGAGATYAVYATRRAATVVPGPPLVRAAEPANATSALVSWDPPTSDGGETIESYTVTSNPGGITATGSSSPITVTGLTTGVAYTFTVTATNAGGTGPASAASNSMTPAAQGQIA
jgi:hypothetical protein